MTNSRPTELPNFVPDTLNGLNEKLAAMNARLDAGEDVPAEELEILGIEALQELEALNKTLAQVTGPLTEEEKRELARERMSPAEYNVFLKDQAALTEYRARPKQLGGL